MVNMVVTGKDSVSFLVNTQLSTEEKKAAKAGICECFNSLSLYGCFTFRFWFAALH